MTDSNRQQPKHLAWHETLELHELVALQSTGLFKLKRAIGQIKDAQLRNLYNENIRDLDANIRELLKFYSLAPREDDDERQPAVEDGFNGADLLAFTKSLLRAYAIAIGEAATPALREVFVRQLQKVIRAHERAFNYLYQNGLYPAYDLHKLLEGDVIKARAALNLRTT